MKAEYKTDLALYELEDKIASLHFFKEVGRNDRQQLRMLVGQSRLVHAGPGEVLLKAGDRDSWLYFLMRGELMVCAPGRMQRLGRLIAGEVFGDISVITGCPRKTDILVPPNGREVVVLALDFRLLSDLQNHTSVSLATKLIVYRHIVHMLRWRSDLYRIKFPRHDLVKKPYRMVQINSGISAQDELVELGSHARYLAKRLQYLNEQLGAVDSGAVEKTTQKSAL